LSYVAQYAEEGLMSLEMGYNVLTDRQVWQFMSMYAPEMPVLTNCVDIYDYQLWSRIINSTTVSPVLKNSVKECGIC
jgi:hypothetical protein